MNWLSTLLSVANTHGATGVKAVRAPDLRPACEMNHCYTMQRAKEGP